MSFRRLATTLAAFALLAGCSTDDKEERTPNKDKIPAALAAEAVRTHSRLALAVYEDSLATAKELRDALHAFVADPSQSTFAAAKSAWLAAREPYGQSEALRFYDGPIDNPETGVETFVNAWPLDEAYVDYVLEPELDDEGQPLVDDEGNPVFTAIHEGIVNDASIELTRENLEALNEKGGEENLSLGFHAIEFLLWGQDFYVDGPGRRPYTDYVVGDEGTAQNQARRGQYLALLGDILVQHLEEVVDAWKEGDPTNYRASFEAQTGAEGMRRILTGLIILSGAELAGQRMEVALDNHDQEDEHSCFSDNTHRDIVQNAAGIRNLFVGRYVRTNGAVVSGTGVYDVLAAVDPDLADHLRGRVEESVDLAGKILPPFDQEIAAGNEEGNERVQAVIHALRHQESMLKDVFQLFGLSIPSLE